ncbi:hypothetical protein D3C76_1607340 [compost metagenome]
MSSGALPHLQHAGRRLARFGNIAPSGLYPVRQASDTQAHRIEQSGSRTSSYHKHNDQRYRGTPHTLCRIRLWTDKA